MRRLMLLVATLGVLGVLVYRQRTIDRWERTLGIDDRPGGTARN